MKNRKKFNWNLYLSLLCLAFIPTIYETIKIFFINTSSTSLDVLSQMEWFDLIDEILVTFLTIPLYALLNNYRENKEIFKKKIFQSFIICLTIYILFLIIVYIYANHLVSFMHSTNILQTIHYLRLEAIAFMIGIIYTFFSVIFIIIGKSKYIYTFLIVKMLGLIIGDSIFIQQFCTYGVAYANIIVNTLLGIAAIVIMIKENLMIISFENIIDIVFLKQWFKIGLFVGIQIFLDNWIYAVMVCKMINKVSAQGNYWIANTFIWSWLLVPCTCLTDIIKRDCEENREKQQLKNYWKIIISIFTIWIITIPTWKYFLRYFMQVKNVEEIVKIVLMLVPFYLFYMIAAIFDNIFYGLGKTTYNMIISVVVNILYYGIVYILFKHHFFEMNIQFIIYMFGFGMVVHCFISFVLWTKLKKSKTP